MNTFDENKVNRQQAGTSAGGQFAAKSHPADDSVGLIHSDGLMQVIDTSGNTRWINEAGEDALPSIDVVYPIREVGPDGVAHWKDAQGNTVLPPLEDDHPPLPDLSDLSVDDKRILRATLDRDLAEADGRHWYNEVRGSVSEPGVWPDGLEGPQASFVPQYRAAPTMDLRFGRGGRVVVEDHGNTYASHAEIIRNAEGMTVRQGEAVEAFAVDAYNRATEAWYRPGASGKDSTLVAMRLLAEETR